MSLSSRSLFAQPYCIVLVTCLSLPAACGSSNPPRPAYKAESFSPDSPFQQRLAGGPIAACDFGRRALLSQGYQLDDIQNEAVNGIKYFQPENGLQMRLEIKLVCLPDGESTVVYASAVQTRYELKTSSNSSGLSVSGVGSISLPWTEGKEALVKVAEETVADPDFYGRFFELLKTFAE